MFKDKTLIQLKRIKGQLDGIINMYDNKRGCVDIVRQVIAARNSLGRVAQDLLTGEAKRCTRQRNAHELEKILQELFKY